MIQQKCDLSLSITKYGGIILYPVSGETFSNFQANGIRYLREDYSCNHKLGHVVDSEAD